MTRRVLIIVGLFCLFSLAQAQNIEPPLPVLYADDVFREGITVLERLTSIYYNRREIYAYDADAETWNAYPIPDEVARIQYHEQRPDGEILLASNRLYYDTFDYSPLPIRADNTWMFSPLTGNFTRPDTLCGYVRAVEGEGSWVVNIETDDGLYRLCHTETGEMLASLPDDIQALSSDYFQSLFSLPLTSLSPQGDYLAIVVNYDCVEQSFTNSSVYLYDNETRSYRYEGDVGDGRNPWLLDWFDDTTYYLTATDLDLMLYKGSTEYRWIHELQLPAFEANFIPPDFYFYNKYTGYIYRTDFIFEETARINEYPLVRDNGRFPEARSVNFSVSPDGRYLAYDYFNDWNDYVRRVEDIQTGELLFERRQPHPIDAYQWLSNNQLMRYSGNDSTSIFGLTVMDLSDTSQFRVFAYVPESPRTSYLTLPSPDNHYVPVHTDEREYQLYDSDAGQLRDFLSHPEDSGSVDFRWIDNDTMWVQVGINQWHIRIDPVTEAQ